MSRKYTKKQLVKTKDGPLVVLDGSNYFTFFSKGKSINVFSFRDKFHALNYWKKWASENNMSICELFEQEMHKIVSSRSDEGALSIKELFRYSERTPKRFEMLFDGYLNDVAEDATNILFDLIEMRAASVEEEIA